MRVLLGEAGAGAMSEGDDMIDEDEVELAPFTEDMRAAIRECRFKTVNVAHTQALVYDADQARMEATGLNFTAYRPAQVSEPHRWDHEGRSADERVIEFVAGL